MRRLLTIFSIVAILWVALMDFSLLFPSLMAPRSVARQGEAVRVAEELLADTIAAGKTNITVSAGVLESLLWRVRSDARRKHELELGLWMSSGVLMVLSIAALLAARK